MDNIQPDVDLSLTLTRAKFEEINAPLFKRCMDTVASVLKDALVPIERVSVQWSRGWKHGVLACSDMKKDATKSMVQTFAFCELFEFS